MTKIRNLLLTGLIILICISAWGQNKPFPQGLTYPGCIKPNVSQATLNSDALAYYNYWKNKYLKKSTANANHYYVAAGSTGGSSSAITQSEAHGYGMVITALMAGADPNAKIYYDGLYGMYDTHRSSNNNNLMQWQVFADEHNANLGSATDGDMDIAYSMLLAHYQWGSSGSINYLDAAKKMITNGLKASYIYSTLRLGLADDPTNDHLSTRPSDWMFDHMRAFKNHTNDAIWDQLATNLYNVYNRIYSNYSSNTGLISDFVMYDPAQPAPPGQPQADEGSTTGDYSYNACRIPLRLVMDFAHYGTTAPKPYLSKMVSWAKSKTGNVPTKFQAGYKLNGTALSGTNYQAACFISPMVAASVIDPANQQWLNDGWNYMKGSKDSYYEDTYNMLCILFVSGNWWVPQSGGTVNNPPTTSITAPANGTSYTTGASVTISANATDTDGTIAKVEFFVDGASIGSDATSPYSIVYTTAVGTHSLTAKVTDDKGAVSTASTAVSISVTNPVTQSPYGGTVRNIPGKIEAEHYDMGGEGIAYHDLTSGNSGNAFRTDNVDIEATTDAGAGYNVGWTSAGEWLEYTVNVTTADAYKLDLRIATTATGKKMHVELDGVNISGIVTLPNTTAWQSWQTVSVTTPALTTGQKVMRIVMDTDGFNINYVTFTANTSNPNNPPSASITAPANSSTYTTGTSITISANATDTDGTIAKVEFFVDGSSIGSDATSPYSTIYTAAAGTHSLTAKATDNLGSVSAASAAVSITVNNVTTNNPPSASIASPSNGTTYTAGAAVTISANATDTDGSIAKVEFFVDGASIGSDATSPYSMVYTAVAGTHSLTAKATDNLGAVSASAAAVSITVNPNTNTCSGVAQYVENGGYVDGSKVQNAGSQYQCRPYPYSGWCNGAAWAYAPGTGTYWQDAWTLVGACSAARMAATTSVNAISSSPNPFENSTTISVTVENAGETSLIVYDQLGRQVAVLANGYLSADAYSFNLDAAHLKAGIYVCKFINNGVVVSSTISKY